MKNFKNEISINDLWENFKQPNIPVTGIHKRKGGRQKILDEIMVEKFPDLMKTINPQIQEPQ